MGLPTKTLGPQPLGALSGLSGAEAQRRLQQVGPNQVAPQLHSPAWRLAAKFWGPVAGLIVLAIALALLSGQALAGGVIGLMLLAHGVMAFLQENHFQKVLDLLAQRLSPPTHVFRDGVWQTIPAAELVPGDMVYLQAGDRAPADLRLVFGRIALDPPAPGDKQTAREAAAGDPLYAGSLIRRGEITGEVIATGPRTAFGQTSAAFSIARGAGRFQKLAQEAAKHLALFDVALSAAALVVFALAHISLVEILPFALILLLAGLPVTLPEALRLATALGAAELSAQGAIVNRLSAIDDAAELQVMCVDKNGTLTENRLRVAQVRAYPPYDELDVLHLAAMASDDNSQDPSDLAILEKTRTQGVSRNRLQRRSYAPADLATRHSEAVYEEDGDDLRVIKGAPAAVLGLAGAVAQEADQEVRGDINLLSAQGGRVIAVAVGTGIEPPHLAGLVALQDPVRPESAGMVKGLHELGVKVVMISNEPRHAAQAVARQVGLTGEFCGGTAAVDALDCDVCAEVLPEDKYNLVKAYQQAGYRVGMTGDSLYDRPALQQADLGAAVAGANDGARAAAGLVLTQPGLANLVAALGTSRQITRRMLAIALTRLVNGFAITLLLGLGLILTANFIITPLLTALLVLSNDFTSLTLAFDAPAALSQPKRWEMSGLLLAAASLALPVGALGLGAFWFGQSVLHLAIGPLQTLVFATLAFSGQGVIYLARERRAFWASQPGKALLVGSILAIVAIILMAALGILMSALPLGTILGALAVSLGWMGIAGWIKARV